MNYTLTGALFCLAVLAALWTVRPNAILNRTAMEGGGRRERLVLAAVLIATILACTLPMSLSPFWNGEFPEHRNQYEVMTQSLLDGHLYMDYDDVDPRLLEMENPYDPDARTELGVSFHWDHAFYNGHYYMYFGIVPVLVLFLPFQLLTGVPLLSYQATQIFTALFIAGLFALFRLLGRKFFPALSWASCIALSAAAAMMSVWYITGAPALYCTAIASGICMEVWSLYCFVKAVYDSSSQRKTVLLGVLGSTLGALAFGCRPPIALANLLALPMFLHYVRGRKWDRNLLLQVGAVALPYVLVAAGLMAYNYARFGSLFEFGQRYQLTVADQSSYAGLFSRLDLAQTGRWLLINFFRWNPPKETFPYVSISSVFVNFPVCALGAACLFLPKVRAALRERGLGLFTVLLFLLPVLITVLEVLMSPYLMERYRSDIYWLMGLLVFVAFGALCQSAPAGHRSVWCFAFSLAALLTAFKSFLLWACPYDFNFTECYPHYLDVFDRVLRLGLGS